MQELVIKMRYIFFIFSLNIFNGNILPVKGQCTVSACTDSSTGSHDSSIETQEEYYQNVQIILGQLSFNMERIGGRFEDSDEAGKIWLKDHYHDLLNVYQNLSAKIDALGESAIGLDKCFVDKDLDQMYQNLSLRLQGIDKSLLLLSNAEQSVKESLKGHDQNLQAMHRNMTNGIDGIHKKIENAEHSLHENLEVHDQTLQILHQNMTSEIYKMLTDTEKSFGEMWKVHGQNLQLMNQNMTNKIDSVHKKLTDSEQNYRESLEVHNQNIHRYLSNVLDIINKTVSEDEQRDKENMASLDRNMQAMYQNITSEIDGIYQSVSDTTQNIKANVERLNQNVQTVSQNMSEGVTSIQSRIINAEENIKERIQSHDLSLQRLDQKISTEVDRIDGRLQSLVQQMGEIYQLLQKTALVSSEENLALNRSATQSSTYGNHDASRAVDGNTTTVMASGSCSHTNDRPGGPNWWRVQLDRPYRVGKVTVTNRGDCCAERLDYFIVGVTNSTDDPVRGNYSLCGQYPSTAPCSGAVTVYCDPNIGAGQYVIIQQPANGRGWLTLCEVEVYAGPVKKPLVSSEENLALNRSATQSSTYENHDANRAVDGDTTSNLASDSCAHINDRPGGPNWWRVKLNRPYRVGKVTVTNRGECCGERLDYFIVGVTNSTADPVRGNYSLCGQYPSTAPCSGALTVYCDPDISAGQYVIIQQPANGRGWLTLCEVEVYAGPVKTPLVSSEENLALNRSATQSSIYENHDANRAVDGNTTSNLASDSCAHINDRSGGPNWWRVKLDRPYRVKRVTVTNRNNYVNRLDYFIVGVTNSTADPVRGNYTLCGQYPSTACSTAMTVYCDPDIGAGQYVIIQQPINGAGALTLCEVEVYGERE